MEANEKDKKNANTDFYTNYSEFLDEQYSEEPVVFQLQMEGQTSSSVKMLRPTPEKNYLTIKFGGWGEEDVYVDLSDNTEINP